MTRIAIDLSELQAEAEIRAQGGDPVHMLANMIFEHPTLESFHFGDNARFGLESALLTAAMQEAFPPELVIQCADGSTVSNVGVPMKPKVERDNAGRQRIPDEVRPPVDAPPRRTIGLVSTDLFDEQIQYPNAHAFRTFESLVGLDEVKARLVREAVLLTNPERLERWSRKHHGSASIRAIGAFRLGTPFLIFAGDVGTGKTALAESFGDAVARELGQPVSLLRMSIQARGSGIVGDMTRQITKAFRVVEQEASRTRQVTIFLLDEADTLAESRETQQMHHEDRAGVNALIQGVDRLRNGESPVLVVFCSNRLDSIDPAIRRRAIDIVQFTRPSDTQRKELLQRLFGDLGLSPAQMRKLVELTGPSDACSYGFTYSDISDRVARNAVLRAFPDRPLSFDLLQSVAVETVPTRPFGSSGRSA